MVLVPLTEWQRLKERQYGNDKQQQTAKPAVEEPQQHTLHIVETEDDETSKRDSLKNSYIESIVALLPKQQHARAKIILHYIISKIDPNTNSVAYDSGVNSSHIIDLLRFVLNPLSKRVPKDGSYFCHFLKTAGVPDSVYTSRLLSDVDHAKEIPWLTLK